MKRLSAKPMLRRPDQIPGFQPRGSDNLRRLAVRELVGGGIAGIVFGFVAMAALDHAAALPAAMLLGVGLAAGGLAAEQVFFHEVGTRLADPLGPGAYVARALLWALGGAVGAFLAHLPVVLLTGIGFAGAFWLVAGAALNVLAQAPFRVWLRRRDRRMLARIRR